MSLETGYRNGYEWLITDHDLSEFLQLCPDTILGKYIAVTADDSGPMTLLDAEMAGGWTQANAIAYSPRLLQVDGLPHQGCGHFHEWYVFETPIILGTLFTGNVFEAAMEPGKVAVFVNYLSSRVNADDEVARLFWKQLAWIRPESYLADGDAQLTFVSWNSELFSRVRETLIAHPTTPC